MHGQQELEGGRLPLGAFEEVKLAFTNITECMRLHYEASNLFFFRDFLAGSAYESVNKHSGAAIGNFKRTFWAPSKRARILNYRSEPF